jgi:predicted DNA-binding transcriptional regulator AlpA
MLERIHPGRDTAPEPKGVELSNHAIDSLPALLPVPRAAQILGLSRASAYRYAAAGELPVKRFGGRVHVVTAKIRALLDGSEELAA